ncbi:hypothetical protein N9L47_08110 [Rhodobacteraceae bacterium]|nr:hypothetical protein [Paracoccaceae bacterium]
MFARAFALLFLAITASVAATLAFGEDVLFALGLILAQSKLIVKKLTLIKLPAVLTWIKAQASAFFKIELMKKWIMTTLLPLLLGKALLRRFAAYLGRYRQLVRRQYMGLLHWYRDLHPVEKVVAALIILCATVAVSVTSLGLWLILFSVKLPLWIAAVSTALWKSIWVTVQKMTFKTIAFLQLNWLGKAAVKVLPASWVAWKRRLDYRMARAVIRRRRMTIRQLAERKDSLPFRLGLMAEFWTKGAGRDTNQR